MGGFLDSFPTSIFIAAHVVFLLVGLWVIRKVSKQNFGAALWLYAVSQLGFLAVFGGLLTLKMGVLIEQTLILIMVLWIAMKSE